MRIVQGARVLPAGEADVDLVPRMDRRLAAVPTEIDLAAFVDGREVQPTAPSQNPSASTPTCCNSSTSRLRRSIFQLVLGLETLSNGRHPARATPSRWRNSLDPAVATRYVLDYARDVRQRPVRLGQTEILLPGFRSARHCGGCIFTLTAHVRVLALVRDYSAIPKQVKLSPEARTTSPLQYRLESVGSSQKLKPRFSRTWNTCNFQIIFVTRVKTERFWGSIWTGYDAGMLLPMHPLATWVMWKNTAHPAHEPVLQRCEGLDNTTHHWCRRQTKAFITRRLW